MEGVSSILRPAIGQRSGRASSRRSVTATFWKVAISLRREAARPSRFAVISRPIVNRRWPSKRFDIRQTGPRVPRSGFITTERDGSICVLCKPQGAFDPEFGSRMLLTAAALAYYSYADKIPIPARAQPWKVARWQTVLKTSLYWISIGKTGPTEKSSSRR